MFAIAAQCPWPMARHIDVRASPRNASLHKRRPPADERRRLLYEWGASLGTASPPVLKCINLSARFPLGEPNLPVRLADAAALDQVDDGQQDDGAQDGDDEPAQVEGLDGSADAD